MLVNARSLVHMKSLPLQRCTILYAHNHLRKLLLQVTASLHTDILTKQTCTVCCNVQYRQTSTVLQACTFAWFGHLCLR